MNSISRKNILFYFPFENSCIHPKVYLLSKETTEAFGESGIKMETKTHARIKAIKIEITFNLFLN